MKVGLQKFHPSSFDTILVSTDIFLKLWIGHSITWYKFSRVMVPVLPDDNSQQDF